MSNPKVELHIAGRGVITLELDQDKAPKSVANFLAYVNNGHYDNTVFHRVIKNFMLQGGGFEPGMKQKPTLAAITNEADNGLKNARYTVAMARTSDPHSATAQFFINVVDNSRLDPVIIPPGDPVTFEFQGQVHKDIPRQNVINHPQLFGYTVFGKVVSGMDTIEKIRNTPTGSGGPFPTDVPQKPVVIESARLAN